MAKLIILEGLSRTGKTTIANNLHKNGYGRIISLKEKMPDNCDLASFYKGTFYSYDAFFRAFPKETFILDRSFVSEMVYSRFFDRHCQISNEYVSEFLETHDVKVYFLSNNHEDYMKRGPKDKIIYDEKQYKQINDLFEDSLKTCMSMIEGCEIVGDFVLMPRDKELPFLKIDTSQNNLEQTINLIKEDYGK